MLASFMRALWLLVLMRTIRVDDTPYAPFQTYFIKRESGFKSKVVPIAADSAERKRMRRKECR